ncbi:hypothetical protein COF68_06100 [Bacillus toyonensis]|uniref:hypothetical protein n=1 Tax=Bacillus toyonensis TaxID=155322 RepID=UPI000BFD8458|nr:hypothetical protein [Bacillus toyonensis]PHE64406.1 hypothetical protein COF68_06100 [Bacillus toyonensis]
MTTETKQRGFKQQVYDELRDEVSIASPIVGYDADGYLTSIALSRKELVTLMKNKETKGVIATDTSFGAVGFDFKSKRSVADVQLTPIADGPDICIKPIIQDSDVAELVDSNNRFIDMVKVILSSNRQLKVHEETITVNGSLPPVKTLTIYASGLSFLFTELQMSILTNNGVVVIHGNGKDLYAEEIAELVAPAFDMKEIEFVKAISTPY